MNSNTPYIIFQDSEGVFLKAPSSTDENIVYDVHVFHNFRHFSICELFTFKFRDLQDWICNCPGWYYRHTCKHVTASQEVLA